MRDARTAHPYARSVARALERAGFLDVTLEDEVAKAQWRTNGRAFIPFDVSYLALAPSPHREYLECKHHERRQADERDVAKFIEDLRTCGLDTTNGAVITTCGYTHLAMDYARQANIRLYTYTPTDKRRAGVFERAYETLVERPRAIMTELRESLSGTTRLPGEFMRMA